MWSVGFFNRVRRACHVDGMSKNAAGRLFGIDRKSVAKILLHSVLPGYRRTVLPVRPKLDPYIPIVDQILEDDKRGVKRQRHTAKRIHARLRDEHGVSGGRTIVTDCVQETQRRTREVLVPLSPAPGHARADFGETLGGIGGVDCRRHHFAMALPHSDAVFIKTGQLVVEGGARQAFQGDVGISFGFPCIFGRVVQVGSDPGCGIGVVCPVHAKSAVQHVSILSAVQSVVAVTAVQSVLAD